MPHQSPSHTSTCDCLQYEYSNLSENIRIVGNIRTVLGLHINIQTLLTFPDKVAGTAGYLLSVVYVQESQCSRDRRGVRAWAGAWGGNVSRTGATQSIHI